MIETVTRNASLADLGRLLTEQQARKVDMVVAADNVWFHEGMLHIVDVPPVLQADGVTAVNGMYVPTAVFDEGIANKLEIPLPYLRKMREKRVDLLDANVNGWLHGADGKSGDRTFLIRAFKPDSPGEHGIARAFLSDRFKPIDNLDVLTAILQGVREVNVDVKIAGCDLSERRMSIRFVAPEVVAYAKELLKHYRSPFTGKYGMDNPLVWAGLAASNSETGNGAFGITPRMELQVCKNGMTITKDALREVHLGGKLDEGVISWSEETQNQAVQLIVAKTRDAVKTFLDVDYMTGVIAEMEKKSGRELSGYEGGAMTAVGVVCKKLSFDQATTQGVLDYFIKGADTTAGGMMQAVTAYAQTVEDPDKAAALEDSGVRALELAAAL